MTKQNIFNGKHISIARLFSGFSHYDGKIVIHLLKGSKCFGDTLDKSTTKLPAKPALRLQKVLIFHHFYSPSL